MEYFGILGQTWKLIWKQKVIMAFGLLAVLVPGLMGLLMGGTMMFFAFDNLNQFERMMDNEAWFGLAWLGIFGVFMLLSLMATGVGWAGVFKGTFEAETGKDKIIFSDLWKISWPYIGRVLGIILLIGFGLALFFMVPAVLGILTAGLAFICMLPMMVILIPLSFLSQMYMSLSIASSVAENVNLFTALKRAWSVMLRNFWPLALMSLLLYLVQLCAGIVISIPAGAAQMFFVIPLMNENINPANMIAFFGIFMIIVMPLAFLLQGAAQTYVNSAWMLVYLDRTRTPLSPETPIFAEPNA